MNNFLATNLLMNLSIFSDQATSRISTPAASIKLTIRHFPPSYKQHYVRYSTCKWIAKKIQLIKQNEHTILLKLPGPTIRKIVNWFRKKDMVRVFEGPASSLSLRFMAL